MNVSVHPEIPSIATLYIGATYVHIYIYMSIYIYFSNSTISSEKWGQASGANLEREGEGKILIH